MKKITKILLVVTSLILVLITLTGCGNETINKEEGVGGENNIQEMTRGEWKNNIYTSEFADITFKLPEGWTYKSDEEIAAMMNIGAELLNDDQQKLVEIAEQTGLYDMVANNTNTGSSVMVLFEKPLLDVTVEFYLNNVKQGLEAVEAMNYEISKDITKETVGGREYSVLTATVPAYNMVQKYYVEKKGDYFAVILVTYIETLDSESSILANFQ